MARISELHYSNALANSSGVAEFLEIALRPAPAEDPADFTVSFYQSNGNVGIEIPLTDPGVQVSIDPDNGEQIFVISADFFNIRLTDPDGGGSNNYEAYALTNTDTSTVVDFYDIGGGTQNITANDGVAAGAVSENLPVLVGPNSTTTTLQFNQPNPDTLTYETLGPGDTGLACFVSGTRVNTPNGPKPIQDLESGDCVNTVGNGAQPVRWIGRRTVSGLEDFAPVRIAKGTLGANRDILVSPQHRVLITGWQCELLFGHNEILVPAIALVNGSTVTRAPASVVSYVHILFDQHELLRTSGFVSESFFPGEQALKSAGGTQRELLALFPEATAEANRIAGLARPSVPVLAARLLEVA